MIGCPILTGEFRSCQILSVFGTVLAKAQFGFIVRSSSPSCLSQSMSQLLPDSRSAAQATASKPTLGIEAGLSKSSYEFSFDDYDDADLELAWLGYILASSQYSSHLRTAAFRPRPRAAQQHQRWAISSEDLLLHSRQQQFHSNKGFHSSYTRSKSDTCLAAEDRCDDQ